ncbi:MAG: purine-nucleoside phosphorylase [Gemmatimonadota bacterium]
MTAMPGRQKGTMERIREAVEAIRGRADLTPGVGIVLGTESAGLVDGIENRLLFPYQEIPHFPRSIPGTRGGRLSLGKLAGTPVAVMEGPSHRHPGSSLQEETFPVRVLRLLGAEVLVASGVWGGLNPLWRAGELVLLEDHINLLGDNPLVGDNPEELGPRFPDMSEPYDRGLRETAKAAALEAGVWLNRGIYAALMGPGGETRAECRMLRRMGADVVGKSIVPEVIVARHMDMRVLGLGMIGDERLSDGPEALDPSRTIEIATQAQPRLTALIRDVVSRL